MSPMSTTSHCRPKEEGRCYGNVWYLGEDSSDCVNGEWVRSDGSWETGVDGAKPGIVMEADPNASDLYRQEYYSGHAEDLA
jgi:hypothetical protein